MEPKMGQKMSKLRPSGPEDKQSERQTGTSAPRATPIGPHLSWARISQESAILSPRV